MWSYAPVSIRLVSSQELHGLSGIHLVQCDPSTKSLAADQEDFVLTFNYLPNLQDFNIIVSSHGSSQTSQVTWYPAKVHQLHEIPLPLTENLDDFRKNGFRLFPHDSHRASLLSVAVIKLAHSARQQLFQNAHYSALQVANPKTGQSMEIISNPFTFNNSLLFANFVSRGTINYSVGGSHAPVAHLADIRYMENMIGGIAKQDDKLVGLVLGNLKKSNGDGDLLTVVPWNSLRNLFDHSSLIPNKLAGVALPEIRPRKLAKNALRTQKLALVFPIQVKHQLTSSWGSCVYYNQTTFITNLHVVKPFLDDPKLKLEILLDSKTSILFEHSNCISTPSQALDLVFIKVDPQNILKLDAYISSNEPNPSSLNVCTGDKVTSYSYGLFFNPNDITPLVSTGIINTMLALPVGAKLGAKHKTITSMIVTSSSCWNGSSGGGLFNSEGRLVGLICSNAQVSVPSLEEGTPPASVKIPQISFVLPIDLINYCYVQDMNRTKLEISSDIGNLWQLKQFHVDIVQELSKL
ncbi:uncharacterized protein CANTADRAFT_24623 [Suhomyces tanzawaensis NRRL Y-17324]|uniref:Trypsin-like serine protease n=1 Tax=Suhomyces tanzawaensis NRRL Y-17324 TaxID=984487 RepID=A0A1E4SR19_9ASCO|nr:uncharacterized protein CANTADRAFT_24623 [Suhomyces tanzawaensis NRRL Y-17324]ODV81852.1 hypothetical protein CANTADRAFT_24623 [Suhomyces tanzawaensis NRRL Y-17324]